MRKKQMLKKTIHAVCLLMCVFHVAIGQEVRIVAPPGVEATEGNLAVPNDPSTVLRVQEQWSASFFSDLPVGGAWLVGIASRLDGNVGTETTFTQNLEIDVSTSTRDRISTSYQENVGDDVVRVFVGSDEISYSVAGGGQSTNPFSDPLVFDTPFFYDPLEGDLVLDWRINGGVGSAIFDSQEQGMAVANVGPIDGSSGSFTVSDHVITEFVFDVPEPSSGALGAFGVFGVLLCRRRRV